MSDDKPPKSEQAASVANTEVFSGKSTLPPPPADCGLAGLFPNPMWPRWLTQFLIAQSSNSARFAETTR